MNLILEEDLFLNQISNWTSKATKEGGLKGGNIGVVAKLLGIAANFLAIYTTSKKNYMITNSSINGEIENDEEDENEDLR